MTIKTGAVERIRQFNRFYTQVLGLLNNKLMKSSYSLAEARILFELGQHPGLVSKDLARDLHIDPAYLSRILKRFKKKGLVQKETSPHDTRRRIVSLTSGGRSALAELQEMSNRQIRSSLADAADDDCRQLLTAMDTIERIFGGGNTGRRMVTIRPHRQGDLGYITFRHAEFYSKAYGFDQSFDVYVAMGLSDFISTYDPEKEHLWVAEEGSGPIGSIAIVKKSDKTAQLRWFLVEPASRGNGLGRKLLSDAVEFSRGKQYEKIILWTLSNLDIARKLYEQSGFKPAETKTHEVWGQRLTEEMWVLDLND